MKFVSIYSKFNESVVNFRYPNYIQICLSIKILFVTINNIMCFKSTTNDQNNVLNSKLFFTLF